MCVNGGTGGGGPGTWSTSLEWLVRRLVPRFPELAFGEVKYRIKSWKRLDMCAEDALAAIEQMGAPRTLADRLLDGRRGGDQGRAAPSVEEVVGLAPWIPSGLDSRLSEGAGSSSSTAASTASSRASRA